MGKLNYYFVSVIILLFAFTLMNCNSNSSTQSNSVEKIDVSVKNDSLNANIDVENTTSDANKSYATLFTTDSVTVRVSASKHTAGKSAYYLISGTMIPDTTFRGTLDSVTTSPLVFRAKSGSNNTFDLVLKGYTGTATVTIVK